MLADVSHIDITQTRYAGTNYELGFKRSIEVEKMEIIENDRLDRNICEF